MRLLVLSDLHLDPALLWSFPADLPDYDVAVLAGDIDRPIRGAIAALEIEPELFRRPIVYVPGNYEFYSTTLQDSRADGRVTARTAFLDLHLLDRQVTVIQGVRFIGCTLWTDYRLAEQPGAAMLQALCALNDHQFIRYRDENERIGLFLPAHALEEHRQDRAFLEAALAERHDGPTVVVTHHCPLPQSMPPEEARSAPGATFGADLTELIMQHQPDLWVHGHSHASADYRVGRTRIVTNPKGFGPVRPGEAPENAGFDPTLVISVGAE